MSGFFARQCVDDTGRQAVKLERWIMFVLVIYLIHIALSFFLTTVYRTSLIGPIFSLVGLLVGIGILGSYKRDHTMTCVYIGILAIELVLGVIGTTLWVVEGVVISSTKLQVIGGPDQRSKTAYRISVVLAATIPIVILINLYCLVQAAKLKIALKEEKKQQHATAIEDRVLLLVEEIVTQQLHLHTIPEPPKPQKFEKPPKERRSARASQKEKQRPTSEPSSANQPNPLEAQIDIPEGGSPM
eukprot:Phypoly_transcript_16349.p1 GENE.Phypoly_transcript_16349~~Phypoly_transcript_16349.p1  ORF type:complete len:243 (+),score=33.80 Phypoly_transcript_16349:77-805(+)